MLDVHLAVGLMLSFVDLLSLEVMYDFQGDMKGQV